MLVLHLPKSHLQPLLVKTLFLPYHPYKGTVLVQNPRFAFHSTTWSGIIRNDATRLIAVHIVYLVAIPMCAARAVHEFVWILSREQVAVDIATNVAFTISACLVMADIPLKNAPGDQSCILNIQQCSLGRFAKIGTV